MTASSPNSVAPATPPSPEAIANLAAPPLNHAAIGNGRILALVSPTSAIEWLCLPRFDSPSVFGRLLDHERGGTWRVLHQGREMMGEMSYLPNTNIAVTRFAAPGAAWEVIDFAPRIPSGLSARVPLELVRVIRPIAGQPRLSIDLDPRPDYGRARVDWSPTTAGMEGEGGGLRLQVSSNIPVPYVLRGTEFVLSRPSYIMLTCGRRTEAPELATVLRDLELTTAGWRQWVKTCALPQFAAEAVLRSALCLKLHASDDTGAIIAAATTSIPEAMGSERTWDYRYCWLRDAAFVVEALRRLSQLTEGEQFLRFLRDVAESGPLQPVYGIGGERNLEEQMLPHLAGFGGNGFVRVGNAAALQIQNDLMGEIVLCLETFLTDPRLVHDNVGDYLPLLERLVEEAIRVAPERDTGIWEYRSILKHYTFSKAMCWVAMHRGAELARGLGAPRLAERWEQAAGAVRQQVLERGFNPELGYFTAALDGTHPDSSILLLPTLGLIDPKDPRMVATVDAYRDLLTVNGLFLRYRAPDDFGETTSAFTICSFWYAEVLALMGRLDEAMEVFQRVLGFANPVGLFSEDIDPASGRLLGNFPQAYTHVGLIHAATTIGELIEARDGRVRAWG
jgi:GH15 family glucan-1,4-alpha-glucosidase